MVLYKRKAVRIPAPGAPPPEDALVWWIPLTNEYFERYEDYLDRMDFYKRRKFICELTGHTCLTYFEAHQSEQRETKHIIRNFPEALKEPILRKIQFSTISRLDQLVDDVYNTLRNDFFPGEVVIAKVREQRIRVIIREKAKFNALTLPNGEVRPAYARFRVEFVGNPEEAMDVGPEELTRDRRQFTKVILRTFIKHSVSRESWSGAPWLVKGEYAKIYRISQEVPPELQRKAPAPSSPSPDESASAAASEGQTPDAATRKEGKKRGRKKREQPETPPTLEEQALALIPKRRGRKPKNYDQILQHQQQLILQQLKSSQRNSEVKEEGSPAHEEGDRHDNPEDDDDEENEMRPPPIPLPPPPPHGMPPGQFQMPMPPPPPGEEGNHLYFQPPMQGYPFPPPIPPPPPPPPPLPPHLAPHHPLIAPYPTGYNAPPPAAVGSPGSQEARKRSNSKALLPDSFKQQIVIPPEKPKIMEDLDIPYNGQKCKAKNALPFKWEPTLGEGEGDLIGALLETWLFLNIYHEPLLLDTFTFDDYVEAVKLADEETECSLLNEIHCALLSLIVRPEKASIAIQLPLPPEESDSEDEDEEEENGEDEDNEKDTVKEESKENGEQESEKEDEEKEDEEKEDGEKENGSVKRGPGRRKKVQVEEDEEEDEIVKDNRTLEFLDYQNTSWTERLRRRFFKDGGWQHILIGLLYTISYVDEWKDTCKRALDELARRDRPITLASAQTGYYELPFELKVKILEILCNLIHGSNVVRSYIETCMEESTKLRRERTEKLRELKSTTEYLKATEEEKKRFFPNGYPTLTDEDKKGLNADAIASLRKKKRLDAQIDLAATDADFKEVFERYQGHQKHIAEINAAVDKLEEELIRLDCQRLRMLGKDRFHNRYWWFEANGMNRPARQFVPTPKVKHAEEETNGTSEKDDIEMANNPSESSSPQPRDAEDDDKEADTDEPEDEDDGVPEYVMGRLWIQGPTDEDARVFLNFIKGETELPKLEENDKGEIVSETKGVVVDSDGTTVGDLTPLERKFIEEKPRGIYGMNDWVFYDTEEELDGLISWLDMFGHRESRLLKELEAVKERLITSFRARKEDLDADQDRRKHDLDEQLLELGYSKEEVEASKAPEAEAAKVADGEEKMEEENRSEGEDEEEDEPIKRRRRAERGVNGQNYNVTKRGRPPKEPKHKDPALRAKEIREKRTELKAAMDARVPTRVLEWTNTLAIEQLGHSHYETQKRRGPKRGKKK